MGGGSKSLFAEVSETHILRFVRSDDEFSAQTPRDALCSALPGETNAGATRLMLPHPRLNEPFH